MLAERAADLIRGAATVRPAVQRTPATLPTEKGRGEVAVYASEEQARKTFQELFTAVLADGDFASKLAERGLSLHFVQTDPAVELFVSADGVVLDKVPHPPTLRFELSTDTAHEMWLGKLPIPRAAIARRLAIKGPVARIRQLADLLPTVGATYGALLSQRGN
jgi:hypothetical protein